MKHLFLNTLAASAGGGVTYVRNVIPYLAAESGLQVTIAVNTALRRELGSFANIEFLPLDISAGRRFWFEQRELPGLIRRAGADVLLSAGNFAIRRSPVPQALLSRNSIYLSADYYRDLRTRGEYRLWLDTHFRGFLAKRSIAWADVTIAPSQAFAEDLRRWTGKPVVAIHHGFDRAAFLSDQTPLSADVEQKLRGPQDSLKLLFVSHYNYYRNFETLIRALPALRHLMGERPVKLLLTCDLTRSDHTGAYRSQRAADLVRSLGVSDLIVELGAVPYQQLHQVYRQADAYITPAYTETFAHPLVEAMASGIPVIASDLAVHREICGNAARYFPAFDAETLARTVADVAQSGEIASSLAQAGVARSTQFSWKSHVQQILQLCKGLGGGPAA